MRERDRPRRAPTRSSRSPTTRRPPAQREQRPDRGVLRRDRRHARSSTPSARHTIGVRGTSVYAEHAVGRPARRGRTRKLVVIWGANPTVSNTHFPPLVQQAVERRRQGGGHRSAAHGDGASAPTCTWPSGRAPTSRWPWPIADTGGAPTACRPRVRRRSTPTASTSSCDAAAQWSLDRAARGLRSRPPPTSSRWPSGGAPPARRCCASAGVRSATPTAAPSCRAILALPGARRSLRRARQRRHRFSTSAGAAECARVGRWPRSSGPQRRVLHMHQVGRWMAPGSGDPCQVLFVQGANPMVMCPDQHAVVAAFSATTCSPSCTNRC